MDVERFRRIARAIIDLGAVATALLFIGSYFPRELMFSPTITNGGDMGSHYYPALYMDTVLWPQGKVSGWCPGNYCGFPIFQFYFFLPFWLMALLADLIPLTVAFKLVTVLGTFLLPITSYLCLRFAGVPFPGPALGAMAPLCFIFMEANSMWGGNIPSTLAGEFTFSLGMALAVLFVGTLRWTMEHNRGRAWNGLLVAIIGMSHGYTLLWAGFTSLSELVATRGWWRRFWSLSAIHALAILIMAFWLFPLLAYSKWTTAYSHTWLIKDWLEIMPRILWPPAITAVVTLLIVAVMSAVRREPFPRGLAAIWWAALMGGGFYFLANLFNVVDIRFLPFMQLGLCLAAAAGLGYILGALPMPEVWPLAGGAAILVWVQGKVTFIPSWIRWNYSGFEKKAPWPQFNQVNEFLRGNYKDPRVVFEHSPDYEAIGTIRAFESLPLFSGRSTLEGLYMQGSPTAPFIFYIQAEISKSISCPFPDWGCGRLDLARGAGHLRMMNVSQIVARSTEVKEKMRNHPDYELQKQIGQFDVIRVRDNADRYAVPLETAPIVIRTPVWKEVAYRWFKTAGPDDPMPVYVDEDLPLDVQRQFGGVLDDLPPTMPRTELGSPPTLTEDMGTDRITITGAKPGHPILVRISYHPRWQSLTGERVWLAGPSFMVVFPKSDRIELVFGDGPPVVLGRWLTRFGWLFFFLGVLPTRRRLAALVRRTGDRIGALPPFRPAVGVVHGTAAWGAARRRLAMGSALGVAAVLFVVAAVESRTSDADATYREGQKVYDTQKLRESLPFFQEAQRLAPLSNTAVHSTYYEAIIFYRLEEWAEAEKVFRRLRERFPEANAAPEALYHIGLCRARLGDEPAAIAAWEETQRLYPDTQWAKYSGERLAEHGKK